jgi:hypothetical protein
MDKHTPWGTKRLINGQWRVYYDGYWIKSYDPPADTLGAKKRLIEALTRRLFNHVEHGLNIPGTRLAEARKAFLAENDPRKKRVKGAMLAGALFNRATDVFTKVVEIQALGIEIETDNALMRECEEHLKEALLLGKMVLHRSGDEGIDELWGEPFKAFALPIEDFYRSRYIKIAQTMADIDRIGAELQRTFVGQPPVPGNVAGMFTGIEVLLTDLVESAKLKCETLQTDEDIFDVWASFVATAERLNEFAPALSAEASTLEQLAATQGRQLIRVGIDLVSYITRARVPMSKSTQAFIARCATFRASCTTALQPPAPLARPPAARSPNPLP